MLYNLQWHFIHENHTNINNLLVLIGQPLNSELYFVLVKKNDLWQDMGYTDKLLISLVTSP